MTTINRIHSLVHPDLHNVYTQGSLMYFYNFKPCSASFVYYIKRDSGLHVGKHDRRLVKKSIALYSYIELFFISLFYQRKSFE